MKAVNKILLILAGSAVSNLFADQRPNLIVLLTDDQRANTIRAYDPECPIETPHLDRLANQGIRFDNAFVTTPICVASRASILTGRYASSARVHQFQTLMPDEVFELSYNVLLQQAGYFTGQLGKYGVYIRPDQEARINVFNAQEGQGPMFRDHKGQRLHDSEWLTRMTEEFLDQVPEGKPFALQVNYKAPHGSSCPAPEDEGLLAAHVFERHPMDTQQEFLKLPQFVQTSFLEVCYREEFNGRVGDHNPFLRRYHEKIVSVDRSVGEILRMLTERGLMDNTVIIYLSDHGVHFGERQLYGKWTPYDASLEIPFMIFDPRPGARRAAVSREMILNIDVAPTLLELAGADVPPEMDGLSLVPFLTGEPEEWRHQFFFEHYTSPSMVKYIPRNIGLRTRDHKFFRWIDWPAGGVESFYHLAADPQEKDDLIRDRDWQDKISQMRRDLDDWRKANPANYNYDVYEGRRPQAIAPEIDWDRFKEGRPEEFRRIEAQVERFGVTWEQAVHDWKIRYRISAHAGYWY
jgi:arylsulfatase A-like enzyme